MEWLGDDVFRPHPELLVFLTIAVGFLLGRLRYRTFTLGAVTGCLVAIVGLNAGPSFVPGLREAGWPLLLWGALVTTIPLVAGFAYGHFVQRLPLPILLGALAGAQTTTAALGALAERARSRIPALGTTLPCALGNVLLTMWGSVIVLLRR
ncbi:hypothetical protein [Streptomyces sp. NPDC002467]|uniref:aspartate-alanine antiporter-like transporter n=1 Tax=Streptomyces sp. NPDC002467 TaxID=3364647 RepID=UPI0036784E2C